MIFQKPDTCENPVLISGDTVKIPANKLFTFMVHDQEAESECSIVASFTPDQNQKYFVHFSVTNEKCKVSVGEKLDKQFARDFNSDELPVHIVERNYTIGFMTNYCADKISKLHEFW